MQERSIRRLAVVLAVLVAASLAVAQMPSPFSADLKMTTPRQGIINGKMFMSGNNVRMEMNMPNMQSIVITDIAAKVVYTLMPQQ